jgi:suppressor of G2 allele of SKP1
LLDRVVSFTSLTILPHISSKENTRPTQASDTSSNAALGKGKAEVEPQKDEKPVQHTIPAVKSDTTIPVGPPSYPTSSKSGPKNWDNLTEDDEEGDSAGDVNFFFKKLYSGATPDQQRAMMKSFVESNGTSLSTDWNDVKGRTVETLPPDGVEAKKWS